MKKKQKWNGCTPFVKGHKLRVGKKHTLEFKEKRKGIGNPNWRGSEASLTGIHSWIWRNWGIKRLCQMCGTKTALVYDWMNLDHKYLREKKYWKRACRSCHMKYDYAKGFRKPK